MKFYIDSKSLLKIKGLEMALANLCPDGEIISLTPKNPIDERPQKRLEIIRTCEKRSLSLADNSSDKNCFYVGLQKGTTLRDVAEPFFLECHCATRNGKTTHHGISRSVELPMQIRRLVLCGLDIYEAYAEIFGEDVRNSEWSIYEHLTGRAEDKWISKAIEGSLLPFLGDKKHYFLM